MPQNKRKIQNWQIERAKARGSARLRRAALALYAPRRSTLEPIGCQMDAVELAPGLRDRDLGCFDCGGGPCSMNCSRPPAPAPLDSESDNADKAKAGAAPTAAGLPVHPAQTGQMVASDKYPITEISGNGAADTAAGCQQDCESDSRRHHSPTTERYMPTKQDDLNTKTPEIVPQGSLMAPYISTSFLLGDDAEMTLRRQIAARVVPPKRAGLAWGAITHGVWTTNSYAPEKGETFIRWHGEIGFQKADGSLGEATVAYLPKPVQADLITAGVPIVREADPLPAPMVCTFSVECWCVPVRQQPGFGYEIRNRQGRRRNINALAPPEVQALLPQLPPPVVFDVEPAQIEYDNETGEILETSADAEIIADRIIHHAREERDAAE